MSAEITNTSYRIYYHMLINDGILRNMSFGCSVDKDKWKKSHDGIYTREISDLTLYEVSVVTNPAYPQSSIQARGMSLVNELEIPSDIEVEEEMEEVKQEEVVVEETPIEEKRTYTGNISESDIQAIKDYMKIFTNILENVSESRSSETEKVEEEIKEEVVEEVEEKTETITEEKEPEIVEEETKDEETVEEKEETEERSIDLTEYYNILDRL